MKGKKIMNTRIATVSGVKETKHMPANTALNSALTQSHDARDAAKGHFNLARLSEIKKVPLHEIIQSTQEAIDLAWAHPTPAQKAFQEQHFPNGKPSPALFVGRIAGLV